MGLFRKERFEPFIPEESQKPSRKKRLYTVVKVLLWLWALWGIISHFLFPESASWVPLVLVLGIEVVHFFVSMYEDMKVSRERVERMRRDVEDPDRDPDAFTEADKAVAGTVLFYAGFLLFLIWVCGSLIDLAF